ncbi:MAG: AbrB/MazE/SpoVT family DNA-binding domain-containing protein [Marinoscillum sp.]
MKVDIRKWGNSLGLRIPKLLADQMEITENSVVEIYIVKGYIEIKLIKREPTLEELVESVNE